MKNKKAKGLKLPMRQIVDNIIFTNKAVFAVYRIPVRPYDFIAVAGKISMASDISGALYSIVAERKKPIAFQIISDNLPVDLAKWESQLYESSSSWDKTSLFTEYVDKQFNKLASEGFSEKVVFLVIELYKRGELDFEDLNFFEVGMQNAKKSLSTFTKKMLMLPGDDIDPEEEQKARKSEEKIFSIIETGALSAERANAEEIILTIKRMFYPSMPSPYITSNYTNRVGAGEIIKEMEGVVTNGFRYLSFNQNIEGYEFNSVRTCLTLTDFPRTMAFPSGAPPYLYVPDKMGYAFTSWISGVFLPHDKMKSDLKKRQLESKDELKNATTGDQDEIAETVDPNIEVSQAVRDIRELAEIVNSEKAPWVSASYHIVVEAPDEKLLNDIVNGIKQFYYDNDIKIIQTPGDQKQLFIEQMFGAEKKIKDFDQLTTLPMIAVSGIFSNSAVGDPINNNYERSRQVEDPVLDDVLILTSNSDYDE